MKRIIRNTAFLIGALTLAAPTLATDLGNNNLVTVIETDFKGKPPFKRTIERLPAADVAALEAAKDSQAMTRVVTTDFKGKPPFKRNVENLVVKDVASLETVDADNRTTFRGKPPFRRH